MRRNTGIISSRADRYLSSCKRPCCSALIAVALLFINFAAVPQLPPEGGLPTENPSSEPLVRWVLQGELYFDADDGLHGRELWSCRMVEGVPRCELVADINPGSGSFKIHGGIAHGRWLYLALEIPGLGLEPWFWDTKERQATLVQDIHPGESGSHPFFLGLSDELLYFLADDGAHGYEMWVSEVGSEEARLVNDAAPGPTAGMKLGSACVIQDGSLLFSRAGSLLRTDGTLEGTRPVRGHEQGSPFGNATYIGAFGKKVFLVVYVKEQGAEPWITDGTREGTILLKDIGPGRAGAGIRGTAFYRDRMYFAANDGVHGLELWRTDGTCDGTVMVKDIAPGQTASDPHYWAHTEKALFFLANDGVHGKELWKTDGTEDGTALVADLFPGPTGSEAWRLCGVGDLLYLCADTPDFGEEVYVSDGTAEGTHVLKDIVPGPAHAGPHNLVDLDGTLFFTCDDGIHGEELWMSDGTEAGTVLAADIAPPRFNPSSSPQHLTAWGDRLLFVARDALHGEELWISDGTEAGSSLLMDVAPGPASSRPGDVTVMGDRFFFTANAPEMGRALWTGDGAPGGSHMVQDLSAGDDGAVAPHLLAHERHVYFVADDGEHGRELWMSDGTPDGTVLVSDITPGRGGTSFFRGFVFEGGIHYYTREAGGDTVLWRLESSDGEFRSVARFGPEGSQREPEALPIERATLLSFLFPPLDAIGAVPQSKRDSPQPVAVGDTSFFSARNDAHGAELWKTDGSLTGTTMVADAFPGPGSSSPGHFLQSGDRLYFIADDPNHGRVLFRSDGSAQGTKVMQPNSSDVVYWPVEALDMALLGDKCLVVAARDINSTFGRKREDVELLFINLAGGNELRGPSMGIRPGAEGSWPRELTTVGDLVFFSAHDGIHGRELWVTDGTVDGTHLVKDILPPGDLSPSQGG